MTQTGGDNGNDDRLHSPFVQNNDSVSGHPGPGPGGSESDHDRSSDRSDDLSSRESSAEQVTIIIKYFCMAITKYFLVVIGSGPGPQQRYQ